MCFFNLQQQHFVYIVWKKKGKNPPIVKFAPFSLRPCQIVRVIDQVLLKL